MKQKNNQPPGLYEQIYEQQARQRASEAQAEAQRAQAAERTAANKRHRSAARIVVAAVLIFVLFAALAGITYKFLFVIRSVEVTGCSRYSADAVCEASGVSVGDNLYSFSYRVAGERLRTRLPYIRSLDVDRVIPDKIVFNITEFTPEFYTYIYGDTYILGDDLTVLDRIPGEVPQSCRRLKLTAVERAVCGEQLVLRSETELNHALAVCEAVLSSDLSSRIGSVDLTEAYNVTMDCDGKYRLLFGTYNDCAIKLRVASAVLRDEMFETGSKARIDLTNTSQTTVTVDNTLVFD